LSHAAGFPLAKTVERNPDGGKQSSWWLFFALAVFACNEDEIATLVHAGKAAFAVRLPVMTGTQLRERYKSTILGAGRNGATWVV
jgi:hypothetical protein